MGIEDKGSYYYLTSEDKMRIIENLTAKQKAVIRRDYLIANFKDAFGNNATASLLLDFAQKHMPEELANIQDGYNEVYEKRHQRIEEDVYKRQPHEGCRYRQYQRLAKGDEPAVCHP